MMGQIHYMSLVFRYGNPSVDTNSAHWSNVFTYVEKGSFKIHGPS